MEVDKIDLDTSMPDKSLLTVHFAPLAVDLAKSPLSIDTVQYKFGTFLRCDSAGNIHLSQGNKQSGMDYRTGSSPRKAGVSLS